MMMEYLACLTPYMYGASYVRPSTYGLDGWSVARDCEGCGALLPQHHETMNAYGRPPLCCEYCRRPSCS